MGHKVVCFNCRKAFNISSDFTVPVPVKCPECSGKLVVFNHKFRPPKQSDKKAWQVIAFLYDQGFNFQHVEKDLPYEVLKKMPESERYVEYPASMKEAEEFVVKYQSRARKLSS